MSQNNLKTPGPLLPTFGGYERRLVVISAATAIAAFVLTTVVHELAHASVMLAQGADSVVVHQTAVVRTGGADDRSSLMFEILAGPVATLLQGALCWLLARKLQLANLGAWLLVRWLHQIALAYLGVALVLAIFPRSDLGQLLRLFDVGSGVGVLCVPLGVATLVFAVGASVRRSFGSVPAETCRIILASGWTALVVVHIPLLGAVESAAVLLLPLASVWALTEPTGGMRASSWDRTLSHRTIASSCGLGVVAVVTAVWFRSGVMLG